MSLSKRRISRRALGVVVGASLLVLGLEAPAFAQVSVTGFTPTSGPEGCVVVITGTDFSNPDVTAVRFGGIPAAPATALFEVQSDTELWAVVPVGAVDGFITVERTATNETATSAPQAFDVTADAGGCAPTITSFSPECGTVGTTVTIQGTNLIDSDLGGADVEFSPFTAAGVGQTATHTGQPESPTSLSVNVPAAAETGRIQVTTSVGAPFSTTEFTVVADAAECPAGAPRLGRSITLSLRRHLIARGVVTSTEDPAVAECVASVPVKIQRRKAGSWKNVGSTTTNDEGRYKRRIKDKPGKYRAVAPAVTLETGDVCAKARSPRVRHRH